MEPLTTPRQKPANDTGTLWSMQRHGHRARCALICRPRGWELRVLVDDTTLISERCERGADAFALAEAFKQRMQDKGWQQVRPSPRHPAGVVATCVTR